jgi:tryptophan synthase alpha chain
MKPQLKAIDQVRGAFEKKHPAFMPYFTLGYPDLDTSLEIILACIEAGADLMELGIPFSDPLADGPTIQHSTQVAINNGTNLEACLQAVRELRSHGAKIPFMLMGYINPILAYGLEAFVKAAAEAGANGFIIADLPLEEAKELEILSKQQGLALSFLISPNTPKNRIKFISARSTGFTYLVSITGTTGAREYLPPHLKEFVSRVRTFSQTPLAVGFGISTVEQARDVGKIADGVIVGSALIKAASGVKDPPQAAAKFVSEMSLALKNIKLRGL